jgi:hypothetical protein
LARRSGDLLVGAAKAVLVLRDPRLRGLFVHCPLPSPPRCPRGASENPLGDPSRRW